MINAAIIGLGWWGQTLVGAVQGTSEKIKFTKAVVRHPDQYTDVAEKFGLDLSASYEDVLGDPDIDAVVLATPHSVHLEQIKAAAAADKQIFCEKPVTLTKSDAEEAAAAAAKAGVLLAAGHNRRFHPALAQLSGMLADGTIGPVMHVECNMSGPAIWMYQADSWRQNPAETPAGGLAGMGVHLIDAVIALFGRVDRLVAQTSKVHRTDNLDVMTSILMTLENGIHATIATSLATAWCFDFRVYGENGWAELRGNPIAELNFHPRDGNVETTKFEGDGTVTAELEAFADAINKTADYPVTVDQMVHSVAVFEAVLNSAKSDQWVQVD